MKKAFWISTILVLGALFFCAQRSVLALSNEELYNTLSSEAYRIYNNVDVSALMNNIVAPSPDNYGSNVGPIRSLADQVAMNLYYYQKTGNVDDLNKAKRNILTIIEKYPYWGKSWTSPVAMGLLSLDISWIWKEIDTQTKNNFYTILSEEANFWTWVQDEIRTNPNGQTISTKAGRRVNSPNSSLMTSDVGSSDHLNDTRGEENAWNAQMLATAYAMFPNSPNATKWNEAAKCYAFHAITRNETYCGITTRTVSDDFTLGNHYLSPSPIYTIATLVGLERGRFSYALSGLPVPTEFFHNIEARTNSPIWVKNITECMNSENFEITERCHKGKDWGDKNMYLATVVLMYWAKLDGDMVSENLMTNILNFLNNLYPGQIMFPKTNPVLSIAVGDATESLHWWKNVETHSHVLARYFVLNNYDNSAFRSNSFPYSLQLRTADANQDNAVNLSDFVIWKREFTGVLKTKTTDFNNDGNVNLADFVVWKKNL